MDEEQDCTLTAEQAISMLPNDETIHTFLQIGFTLVGADWDREDIIELIQNAPGNKGRRMTGPQAQSMKHGLAIWRGPDEGGEWVYIETERLEPSPTGAGSAK